MSNPYAEKRVIARKPHQRANTRPQHSRSLRDASRASFMPKEKTMKKFIPALAIAALALTGCASGSTDAETSDGGRLHEVRITLTDGREVTCIKYASYNQGGLSCDWDGTK